VQLIANAVGISTGYVKTVLREHLLMRKVCARWVSRMLDQKMKDYRCELSSENLNLMQLDCKLFLKRIVTGDETWIAYTITIPSLNSKACSGNTLVLQAPGSSRCRHQLHGKIMCTIFWDAEGILLIDFMPQKVTITGVFYADLLHKLVLAIKEKRRGKLTKTPLFLHDNAPAHRSHVGQAAILEYGFEEMHQPPYSPDLDTE